MRRLANAAWVIARRDYLATVRSRAFALFLLAPLLLAGSSGLIAALTGGDDRAGPPPPLVVRATLAEFDLLARARAGISMRMGPDWLPPLTGQSVPGAAVLAGGLDHPRLTGPPEALDAIGGRVGLLIDTAQALRAGVPAPVHLTLAAAAAVAAPDQASGTRDLARGAQLAMFVVTMLFAGMLISNLVEERSSKVIELLAAAVPVDAIFAGKLLGMLAVSLTGIVVWGAIGGGAALLFLPHAALGTPAIGWIGFGALAVAYWMMLYLLLGAVYLGVGAQAGSVREVQTLSLPLTLLQLAFFGLASLAVAAPDRPAALAAAVVPWSAPFAMIARGAERASLWPHLLALVWQAACLVLVIRVAARLFRRNVLKSGGGSPRNRAAAP